MACTDPSPAFQPIRCPSCGNLVGVQPAGQRGRGWCSGCDKLLVWFPVRIATGMEYLPEITQLVREQARGTGGIDREVLSRRLASSVASLPEPEATVFRLRVQDRLTLDAIGQQLGMDDKTVLKVWMRAQWLWNRFHFGQPGT